MLLDLISFNGRLTRLGYIWKRIVLMLVAIILWLGIVFSGAIFSAAGGLFSFVIIFGLGIVLMIYVIVASAAIDVKRLHDIGLSGWWILPLFTLWFLFGALSNIDQFDVYALSALALAVTGILMLVLWPGSKGNNRYGDHPDSRVAMKHHSQQLRPEKYRFFLKRPLVEDDMEFLKIFKEQFSAITKIHVPLELSHIDFNVSVEKLSLSKIKKELKGYGIYTKKIVKL